jgi:hypothetical protein
LLICSQARFQKPKEIKTFLKELRSVWANLVLNEQSLPVWEMQIRSLLQNSLRNAHPLCECLSHLLMQRIGKSSPPLSLEIDSLPMGDLCQLAIFRILLNDDWDLAEEIIPLRSFPSLWSVDGEYDHQEVKMGIELLLCAFDKEKALPKIEDPYFLAVSKVVLQMEKGLSSQRNPQLARLVSFGNSIEAAFAMQGIGIPLGAMKAGAIEIPSFGVQVHPLNDPHLFGIDRKIPDFRIASVSAWPECWLEVNCHENQMETKFFGLTTEMPVSFVFYIKASLAKIEYETFLPGSLRRYSKESKKVVFENGSSALSIENLNPSKMELIPLAGKGCFWDTDFLLSFELPVHDGRAVFQIKTV